MLADLRALIGQLLRHDDAPGPTVDVSGHRHSLAHHF